VGKVNQAKNAEYEGITNGNQGIDYAKGQSVKYLL